MGGEEYGYWSAILSCEHDERDTEFAGAKVDRKIWSSDRVAGDRRLDGRLKGRMNADNYR